MALTPRADRSQPFMTVTRSQPVDHSTTPLRGRATSALAAAGRSEYREHSFGPSATTSNASRPRPNVVD
jgi:hypothetical protein